MTHVLAERFHRDGGQRHDPHTGRGFGRADFYPADQDGELGGGGQTSPDDTPRTYKRGVDKLRR
jgi:hypothetical protein